MAPRRKVRFPKEKAPAKPKPTDTVKEELVWTYKDILPPLKMFTDMQKEVRKETEESLFSVVPVFFSLKEEELFLFDNMLVLARLLKETTLRAGDSLQFDGVRMLLTEIRRDGLVFDMAGNGSFSSIKTPLDLVFNQDPYIITFSTTGHSVEVGVYADKKYLQIETEEYPNTVKN